MREVVLRVPRRHVEEILDRLLPILPEGVREREEGSQVELRLRGPSLPPVSELARVTGRQPGEFAEREVPDDWRDRRRADYVPDVIGGRLVVRPEWAPATDSPLEIVLAEGSAFGGGGHPTTRTCLELLLGIPPVGAFADLGCGSGVLAILAARLGWEPVVAVDVSPDAVEMAAANARSNDVKIRTRLLDLSVEPPPAAGGFVANVPAEIHEQVAGQVGDPLPRIGLLSGFHTSESARVIDRYLARGFRLAASQDAHGWCVARMERPLSDARL